MRDPLAIRLGGLAANLARISSFVQNESNKDAVVSLLNESKHFIEWTAGEVEAENAGKLVELQVTIARWQLNLDQVWSNEAARHKIGKLSKEFSAKVIAGSGLLESS